MKKLLLTVVLLAFCNALQAKDKKLPLMKSKMTESGQIVLNGNKCPFEDLELKGDDYWKGESAEYDFIDPNGKIKSMGCWVTSGKDDILAQDFEGRHLAFKKNDFSKDVAFDGNIKAGESQFPATKPTKTVSQRPKIIATAHHTMGWDFYYVDNPCEYRDGWKQTLIIDVHLLGGIPQWLEVGCWKSGAGKSIVTLNKDGNQSVMDASNLLYYQ